MLRKFYAVTGTSVYFVKDRMSKTDAVPMARKIALKSDSDIGVGQVLRHGTLLAITERLQMYIPEGGGITSFQRKIEKVNTRYWGGHSSDIVALFTSKEEAMKCFESDDLVPRDPRWKAETEDVLSKIGDDHPTFYVCKYPGLSLLAS